MAEYTPGHSFYAAYVPEIASITEGAAGAEPTLTTTHTFAAALAANAAVTTPIGQINPADIVIDDGDEKGFGAGGRSALYDQEKGRTYDITINQRVTDLNFIGRCLSVNFNGPGYEYSLPETAIVYGTDTAAKIIRQAVCNQLSGEFAEGSGSELSITAQMMGIYPDTATLPVPTYSAMRALGAPATWHDMSAFTVDGVSYRQPIAGFSWTQNHNVERKGFRPWYSGDGEKASRCVWALLPHHINGEGELRWHKEILTTSNAWGNIVATIGATTWTWVNCRPSQRRQPGVESSAQLGWTTPFKFDYMTVV